VRRLIQLYSVSLQTATEIRAGYPFESS